MRYGVRIIGLAGALPEHIVKNSDLEKFLDTSSSWIEERTGIKERRICKEGEDSLSLSLEAARKALGKMPVEQIDLILVATSTPEYLYPSTSCRLQAELAAVNAAAFDLSAACSGFIYGLVTAAQFIQAGSYKNVLLVGVDIHSRFLDWSDRSTAILFGDGAGAAILSACDIEDNQLLTHYLRADGHSANDLTLKTVASSYPQLPSSQISETVKMNGRKIYQFAVKSVPQVISKSAKQAGLEIADIDYLVCHQANQRILDAICQRLDFPIDKCLSNISRYANTSAASIPLVWAENMQKISDDSLLALAGFGAGLTIGSVIWKWKSPFEK